MHLRYDFHAIQTKGVIELKPTTKHSHTQHPCGCAIYAALCLSSELRAIFFQCLVCACFFFCCLLGPRIVSSPCHFTVWHTVDFGRDSPIFIFFFCVASQTRTHKQTHTPLVLLGQNSICNIIYHSAMNFRSSSSFGRVEFFFYLPLLLLLLWLVSISLVSLSQLLGLFVLTYNIETAFRSKERRKERTVRTKIERKLVL